MELTKRDTKMIQGLSVLAMLCLHLFDRDHTGLFTPLIFVGGVPLSFYLGQISDFCVMGFAFCSGYVHLVQYEQPSYIRRRLRGLSVLLVNYWIILVVFSVVSELAGNGSTMPGSLLEFIKHVFLLEKNYNGAWWYLYTYVLIVLISPALLNLVKRFPHVTLGLSFLVYSIAFYIRFYMGATSWLLGKFGPFGMTLFEYVLGAYFFQFRLFSRMWKIWGRISGKIRAVGSVFLLLVMTYGHTKIIGNLFIAPATGIVIITIFHFWSKPHAVESAFLFFGEHSTNMWLTHMFFFSTLFTDFVYIAKYPLLIYALLLAITIPLSMVLKMIQVPTTMFLEKRISGFEKNNHRLASNGDRRG